MKSAQQPKEDWLEIIFAGRNKTYGAYRLRKEADADLLRSFLITLLGIGALFLLLSMRTQPTLVERLPKAPQPQNDTIILELPPHFEKPEPTPPTGGPRDPNGTSTSISNEPSTPIVDNDTIMQDPAPGNPDTGTGNTGDTGNGGSETGNGDGNNGDTEQDGDQILEPWQGSEPTFPGGEAAMMEFLNKHTQMPSAAIKYGVGGRVIIQFVVEKDGSLSNIHKVVGEGGFGMEEEAIRVIKKMPRWNPGLNEGNPVRVWMQIPFDFVIE